MKTKEKIKNYLIFTDLDGTLLNHNDYSFTDASEMLEIIKDKNIPLIIVTSKTKDEVIEIQASLNISYPFIIENGAGIFIPTENNYKIIPLGKTYNQTLSFFGDLMDNSLLKGFHQMTDIEVSKLTGLSLQKANLAKRRTFSEPFILEDESDLPRLKKLANKDNFDIVKGGRFYHLITLGQDKSNALKELHKYYEILHDKLYKTIALGDGENDITMLQAADQAILIKQYDNSYINCEVNNLIKSKFSGPKGWNDSLKRFFDVK